MNIEAQKMTKGYGLFQLRQDNKLVFPWFVDSQMIDIPCLQVDKDKHTITLNLLTQGQKEIKKLMELKIVPVLFMNQLRFDQLVHDEYAWLN